MAGVKGRSGRKKSLESRIEEDIKKRQTNIPQYFDALEDLARGGQNKCPECGHTFGYKKPDREALQYLIDRQMGKPTQKSDINWQSESGLSPQFLNQVWLYLVARRKDELSGTPEAPQLPAGDTQDTAAEVVEGEVVEA